MVMHARKPQRISDGYFEKHQTHPYQKYNSKSERRTATYTGANNQYAPLRSPNGAASTAHGSGHSAHGHHHYNHSERDYQKQRGTYSQKSNEKEREHKSCRNKYADGIRPPDKRKEIPEQRPKTNHERPEADRKVRTNNAANASIVNKNSNKYDKRSAVANAAANPGSEWSEHISSSGKKYYYNCISEVSQWEKPREWDSKKSQTKEPPATTTYASRNNHDKKPVNNIHPVRREQDKLVKRSNNLVPNNKHWSNSRAEAERRAKHNAASTSSENKDAHMCQDMDISPDRSTPMSESSYKNLHSKDANSHHQRPHPERERNHGMPPVVVIDNSSQQTGSLLAAALPRIAPSTSGLQRAGPSRPSTSRPTRPSRPASRDYTSSPHRDGGPPTPTHSENMDPHAPPLHLEQALPRRMESLGSYSSVVGSGASQSALTLTPSLINYYRPELTTHAVGWPAGILERQANKYADNYVMGCLQCTQITSELKCARSLVRHTEIQATLQEQKIMYLRQQIQQLEELKTHNTFMSED